MQKRFDATRGLERPASVRETVGERNRQGGGGAIDSSDKTVCGFDAKLIGRTDDPPERRFKRSSTAASEAGQIIHVRRRVLRAGFDQEIFVSPQNFTMRYWLGGRC